MLAMLALDLGVFHRKTHQVGRQEALPWSGVWIALALLSNQKPVKSNSPLALSRRAKLVGKNSREVNELVHLLARSLREQGRLDEEVLVLRGAGGAKGAKQSD